MYTYYTISTRGADDDDDDDDTISSVVAGDFGIGRQKPMTSSRTDGGKQTRAKGDNQSSRKRDELTPRLPTPKTSVMPARLPPMSTPLSLSMCVILEKTTSD